MIDSFTKLKAWQSSHQLAIKIFNLCKSFPKNENVLKNQIQRASISVSSNIAEGFSRYSIQEKIRFYNIAEASLVEVQNQLLIARDISYINKKDFNQLAEDSIVTLKLLRGLIKSLKK